VQPSVPDNGKTQRSSPVCRPHPSRPLQSATYPGSLHRVGLSSNILNDKYDTTNPTPPAHQYTAEPIQPKHNEYLEHFQEHQSRNLLYAILFSHNFIRKCLIHFQPGQSPSIPTASHNNPTTRFYIYAVRMYKGTCTDCWTT
jgi:hypothetical protein